MPRKKRQALVTDVFKKARDQLQKRARGRGAIVSSSGTSTTSTSTVSKDEVELNKLRNFDFDWKYGPCLDITRLQRWDRALKLGLHPPKEVRDIILAHPNSDLYTECVWYKYKILKA